MNIKYLYILFSGLIALKLNVKGQEKINFEVHIKPIIDKHCLHCHQENGIAPFSLSNLEDVDSRALMIAAVTKTKYMPPWRADTSFQHYKNENYLNATEIQLIQQWIDGGKLKGNKTKLVNKKNNNSNTSTEKQLKIGFNHAFEIKGNNKEEFRFFHLPSKLDIDSYIQSIEFVPGNQQQVHHSRIMLDTSGSISGIDGMSEEDSSILQYQTKPLADPFLFGWVPGNQKIIFPKGIGKKIYAKADFIVNVHYAPSPITVIDSSSIVINLSHEKIEREAQTLTLTENNISNQPFILYPNKKTTFYMRSPVLQDTISLISVMPHMHLLGKTFKTYAITPTGQVIPLVHIPSWDFNWQTTYQFKQFVVLPKGTVIYAEASYDNTNDNPLNPFKPARTIGYGWGSKDEMMNLIIYYVKYNVGDETVPL